MNATNLNIDFSNLAAALSSGTRKLNQSGASTAFEALLAQMSQSGSQSGSKPIVAASQFSQLSQSSTSSGSSLVDQASSLPTPIERLEKSLRQSGQSLDKFEVPASERDNLKDVLVSSGYSKDDAEEMIRRATKEDGSVNMGALFGVLPEYQASEGPVFSLNAEDEPLLIQLLQDLGVSREKILSFMEGLPREDGKIMVSGLPGLLADAQPGPNGYTVDKSVLQDLLTRLGLSQEETETLINQSLDSNGRSNPKEMLAILQAAAQRQNQNLTNSLKELAGRMNINQGADQASRNSLAAAQAAQIKAQVLKNLDQDNAAQGNDPLENLLKEAAAALEKKDAAIASEEFDLSGDDTAKQGAGSAAKAQVKDQAQGQAQTAGAESSGSNNTSTAKAEGAAVRGVEAGAQTASSAKSSQAASGRQTLPAHVVRQVSEEISKMIRQNQTTLRLNLKPAELGELSLKLSVKSGVVNATMVTETAAAKGVLDSGIEQLKQLLNQQGIKVERLEVMVNQDNQDSQQRMAQFSSQNQGSSGRGGGQDGAATESRGSAAFGGDESGDMSSSYVSGEDRINLFA